MSIVKNDHWLFVCSANIVRSPTAEYVARKMGCFATSCGTPSGLVVMPLQWHHIEWADVIVCMEREHVLVVQGHRNADGKPIYCWDLPDIGWHPYDTELVELCEKHFRETLHQHEKLTF